jgi:Domain of Unknown Function (DUF1080)
MASVHLLRLLSFGFPVGIAVFSQGTQGQEVNKLNSAEASAGYDLLFNGVDLKDWHAYRLTTAGDAWSVKTNAPLGPRIEIGSGTQLPILTNKKYTNFDLKIDVQTPANGNSGIFTRYEEVATSSANARSGPETQVCGPSHPDCASVEHNFGSCYDMFGVLPALRTSWYNPPGSWNQLRIIAFDSNYVHYGNGKKLLEYKIGTADFIKAYNASKYVSDGNNGRYYDIHPGGILLQHHGETGITFRNIKAKALTVHPFKKDFPTGKWPDTLSQEAVLEGVTTSLSRQGEYQPGFAMLHVGKDQMRIRLAADAQDFSAFNIQGKPVAFAKADPQEYVIHRPQNSSGIVFLKWFRNGAFRTQMANFL